MKTILLNLLATHLGLAAVVAQPVITNQPQSQTNIAGTVVTFTVGATGAPPLSYQWRSHASLISYTNIPFGTEATLVLTNVQPTQRRFAVVVTDAGRLSATSSPLVSLTVVTPPSIMPPNPTASLFADVTLYATNGSGAARSSYQWLFNGEPIAGAVTNRLVVTNVQQTNIGDYAFVVTYSFGSVTSQVATLTITPFAITPANPTASLFADVTLLFTNSSGPPLSYQWLFNGAPIAGEVTNKLVVTNVQKTNAGDYAIVATYAFGSATSQVATLKITPFDSIYFFGDSWTDTGGNGCSWPPPDYYGNRACNGPMWPEYLAVGLGLTYSNSTHNSAHCGDVSAEILAQVRNQIRPPANPQLSLYASLLPGLDLFVMYPGGYRGVYVDPTNQVAVTQIIDTAVQNVSNAVQSLYAKGARTFLYMNQGGTNASDITVLGLYRAGLFDAHTRSYNARFSTAMAAISRNYADVRICEMDFYSLYDAVSQHPGTYGFTDSLTSGLSETNRAFGGPGSTHLFWDNSHATTKFHGYMAAWNLDSLRTNVFEEMVLSTTNETARVEMSHLLIGRDYTLQKSADLRRWEGVQTFTASVGTNQVSQALETKTGSTFYRLQWQQ